MKNDQNIKKVITNDSKFSSFSVFYSLLLLFRRCKKNDKIMRVKPEVINNLSSRERERERERP
jgi:hypothetical protein